MSNIQSVLNETRVFAPSESFIKQANVSGMTAYRAMVDASKKDYPGYWAELARKNIQWKKPFTKALNDSNAPFYKWFEDGQLNVSYNCLDKHLTTQPEKTALIFEADDGTVTKVNYRELHARVCQFANGLKARGIKKGDRVIIYLPMSIEAVVAMQACARIGAIHSVVFGGFSSKSLHERIVDAQSVAIITADGQQRGGKAMPLKNIVDEALALEGTACVKDVIIYQRLGDAMQFNAGRDIWWHDVIAGQGNTCEPEWVDAEHPLFILYTSGSTGKPKGVQHSSAGYLLGTMLTMQWVFDYKDSDVFWCTADVGWITGHSYVTYGPLAMGATEVIFEGVPTYPDAGRFWKMIQDHKVTTFYTAPTAIRSLIKLGDELPKQYNLSTLRLLGSVGEPINPEAWLWYHRVVGDGRCPVVDTWWQTETGGILISPLPGATDLKPGSATKPLFGVRPELVDAEGKTIHGAGSGNLVLLDSWPGQMRTVYGDHARFINTYFRTYRGKYFTGDGCRRDEDGYYWITGRVDDVINVSGHRLGTAEVESALVENTKVAEAAVVAYPHEVKGQAIYAYVTLKAGELATPALNEELKKFVAEHLSPIAKPDLILFTPSLPKTRSGKIMRRILRKIAEGDTSNMGDTSTLADPAVVNDLITRAKRHA